MFRVENGLWKKRALALGLLAVMACAGPRPAGVTKAAPGQPEEKTPVTLPLAPKSRERMLPVGLVVTGSPLLASPAWLKRSLARATGIGNPGSGEVARGVLAGASGGYPPGYAGAAIVMGYLCYLPVGATVGYLSGKAAEKNWQPCIEGLRQELQQMAPAEELRRELKDTLTKYCRVPRVVLAGETPGPDLARQGLKSLLEVELQRVELREALPRGTFFVEVGLRAAVKDVSHGNDPIYQTDLVYANAQPLEKPPGARVYASSPGRRMEAYCGEEGRRVFREEVATGIRFLVEKLLLDLGLWGETAMGGPEPGREGSIGNDRGRYLPCILPLDGLIFKS